MLMSLLENLTSAKKKTDLKFPEAELKFIPNPSSVIKQAGVHLCNLPVVDSHCHVVGLIDYFQKWIEGNPIKKKSAGTVPQFLY